MTRDFYASTITMIQDWNVRGRTDHAAQHFAMICHAEMYDKAGAPFIDHPNRVAQTLKNDGEPKEVVAAGWLHDVVEDTDTTEDELRKLGFSERTVRIVTAVTRPPQNDPNRPTYRAFIASVVSAGRDAMIVKRADILDNGFNPYRVGGLPSSGMIRRYAAALEIITKGLEGLQ